MTKDVDDDGGAAVKSQVTTSYAKATTWVAFLPMSEL